MSRARSPEPSRHLPAWCLVALALLAFAAPSHGSAPPAARPRPATPPASGLDTEAGVPPRARSMADVCGTDIDAAAGLVASHLARGPLAPLATPFSVDVGEIAVIEDDGTFYYSDSAGHTILDLAAATQAFYRTHGDDYDQIAFYIGNGGSTYLGSPSALASAFLIRNATTGIGLDTFDIGFSVGSPSRLKNVLAMNGLWKYKNDPDAIDSSYTDGMTPMDLLGHEFGHLWLAYPYVDSAGTPVPALLGRAYQHWNFFADVDASIMEGSSFHQVGLDSFYTDSVSVGYGGPDLYLMGLISKAETESILVVNDPIDPLPPGIYVPYSVPRVGFRCHGRATYWHVSDIEAVHGPRVPDAAAAPHDFRLAMCLVVPRGAAPTAADLGKLEAFRARFVSYFHQATRYRGTVDVTIDSRAGEVDIEHSALPDRENASAPVAIGARVTMARGSMGLGIAPGSVVARWRFNGGPWNAAPMAMTAPDSFAVTIPGPGAGGTFEYAIQAASDSAGITGSDPPAGLAAPHAFVIGPDLIPPFVAHVPVTSQGEARMPQTLLARVTDNLGVDSVWVEYAVNGGSLQTSPASPAGRDSFAAPLGSGLLPNDVLAYRVLARDASAAHLVAASSATPETLRVGTNWIFDFENGAEGLTHAAGSTSYRDAWRLSTRSASPAGGTGWTCGAPDDTSGYPPHLDACLDLPPVANVPAGTSLAFDQRWQLEQRNATQAWDGARLEASTDDGASWNLVTTSGGYTHTLIGGDGPLLPGLPCWSGTSGWRYESADLTPFSGGTLRLRFRMLADDYTGYAGWFVDRIRLRFPGGTLAAPGASDGLLSAGTPYPNPARGTLRMAIALDRACHVAWTLFDLQGRRVQSLSRGVRPAGAGELRAAWPRPLGAGLYFARLEVAGRTVRTDRIAIVR